MAVFAWPHVLLSASLCAFAAASPTPSPQPNANAVAPRDPVVTPSLVEYHPTKTFKHKRDIFSDIESGIGSILSGLGSDVPSYVASGIPNFFQGFPTGHQVQSSLGLDDAQVKAYPTQVMNIPPYANFTSEGWNVRFHGYVYKVPDISRPKLNDLANKFLIDTSISQLPPSHANEARNVTSEIFILQQGDVKVSPIHLEPLSSNSSNGLLGGVPATGGTQNVKLPYETTSEGDFDAFVQIKSNGLKNGNETKETQLLNTYVDGASLGNATAYLVPEEGLTIVSDIDDILRITKIWEPKEGLLNSFARPYRPWESMPEIYANLSHSLPNLHFHYLTTLPEQVTRSYISFIHANYPQGSFDTRPLNFTNIPETLKVRKYLLEIIFKTFPKRKFILVADTSNSDVMTDYPAMAHQYPNQVQCIWLRNTTATAPSLKFPYDTSGFKGLSQDKYMFFVHSDDLKNLDVAKGQCYNTSIAQNLTYGYQGLPGILDETAPVNGSAIAAASAQLGLTFFAFLSAVFWQFM